MHLNAPCLTPFDALGLVAIDSKSQGISPSDLQKKSAYFSNQRLFLVKNSRPAPLVPPPPPSFKISTLNLGIASSLLQDNKIARYLQPALRFWNSSPLDLAIQVFCFRLRLQAGLSHTTGREELASACVTCFPYLAQLQHGVEGREGTLVAKRRDFSSSASPTTPSSSPTSPSSSSSSVPVSCGHTSSAFQMLLRPVKKCFFSPLETRCRKLCWRLQQTASLLNRRSTRTPCCSCVSGDRAM